MTISTTARRTVLAVAATSSLLAGAAALSGSASASPVSPNGYVTVQTCTSLAGTVQLTPGLRVKAHAESAVVTGTLDGCSAYGQAQPGQGTFTAIVSGTASKSSGQLSGTFTANWPASSGLNPSNGTITVNTTSQGIYSIGGSVTGGAWTGSSLSSGYVVTGTQGAGTKRHPITEQTFVNTAPFNLSRNNG